MYDKELKITERETEKKSEAIRREAKVDNIADEIYNKERRRNLSSSGWELKLDVPKEYLDDRFTYRWVKGNPARLMRLLQQDWHYFENNKLASELGLKGSRIYKVVGTFENGEERKDFLLMKRKDYYQEDKEKTIESKASEIEAQIKGGKFQSDNEEDTNYHDIKFNGERSIKKPR